MRKGKNFDTLLFERQDMEEAPLESVPTFPPPKRKINKKFIYLALVVLALLIFFAFKILGSTNESVDDKPKVLTPTVFPTETSIPSPSDSPTPTPTNTPTPKPTINPVDTQTGLDRSELSVTVQNGSGESGVASKGSDTLKNLGYNVVGTGNADNFEYANVSILVKSGKSEFLNLLKKDLGFTYTVGSTSANLSNGFSSDALVIIGK
ncbi:MAG: hypothetical protein A2798_00315 [Candidatus Levybacteria bacterium RIFCSPHIGHO2_01_FULL_37_17]|nr:MAG: hypothetical protein A2798_00315 [Candidatus Levybacteria bacterium RIFCSPHIGHO2_01_FULL_37_17]OGH36464.1 MAG: hypothetical protein A2959_03050 [Candidatus Levybacteria bacterium RIFCSPLOWO2_01_FULL_38_23]